MSSNARKKNQRAIRKIRQARMGKLVKDYSNEPLFVQKAEASRIFLEQHGFPAALSSGK